MTDPFPAPARDRLISAAMLVLWAAVMLWRQWNHWPEDLSAIYVAGWLWDHGQGGLIYAAPSGFFGGAAEAWEGPLRAMGIADRSVFPFVYPPLWAALAAPVTRLLDPQGFANAVALVQIPLMAASVALAGRIARPAALPLWAWTALGLATLSLTLPGILALWHNQPSITVAFLTLLAVERQGAGRPVQAGLALGLAAAIKVTPAAIVLLFLLNRDLRATATFAATGALLAGLSFLLAGAELHAAFLEATSQVSRAALLAPANVSVKSALAALAAITGPDAAQLREPLAVFRTLPAWLGPAVGLAGVALVAALLGRLAALPARQRRAASLFVLTAVIALFGPLGWQHYYLVPILLLPGLALAAPVRTPAIALWILSLGSFNGLALDILPWPAALYVWALCLAWLMVLAALARAPHPAR